jgi:hypothetical protein
VRTAPAKDSFFRISPDGTAVLRSFENSIVAGIPEPLRADVQSLVVDCLQALYENPDALAAFGHQDLTSPASLVATHVRSVIRRLVSDVAGTQRATQFMFAAQLLACEVFDFLSKAKAISPTLQLLEQTSWEVTSMVFLIFNGSSAQAMYRRAMSLH